MQITLQLYTGAIGRSIVSTDSIIERLEHLLKHIKFDTLIYGWATENIDFTRIRKFTQQHGIELYAWIPVFSELEEHITLEPVITLDGEPIRPYIYSEHEQFTFACPANPKNLQAISRYIDTAWPLEEFDGVFLDRIRYPSAIHGPDAIKSCYCEYCKDKTPTNFKLLLKHKRSVITSAVSMFSKQFKDKGLKVGLDLFAVPFNKSVGQRFDDLVQISDFIKPMYYTETLSPAGMPFEARALNKSGKWGYANWLPSKLHYNKLYSLYKDSLRIGIEWNKVDNIASTSPTTITTHLKLIESAGINHVVLSWDAMEVPDEHIQAVKEFINKA